MIATSLPGHVPFRLLGQRMSRAGTVRLGERKEELGMGRGGVSGQWIVGWWWIFKGEQLQSGRTPSALERKLATSIIKFWGSPQMPITVIRSFFCNANCLIPYPTTPTPMATAKALWLLPWLSCGVSERGASELHESGICFFFCASSAG